ncbi:hypothetical protein ACO2Q1_14875 [Brevundimonas sp. VNH65]|uniref:hypothetical protein n=1 Tax=Brevundimonas sp. VNH65 TaxID=3400917 RepID=UPI003C0B0AD7
MVPIALAALFLTSSEPPIEPQTLYHQAVACTASLMLERETLDVRPSEAASRPAMDSSLLAWGMVLRQFGERAGRSPAQIDHEDIDKAQLFMRQMRRSRPAAFIAHREFCRAMAPAGAVH